MDHVDRTAEGSESVEEKTIHIGAPDVDRNRIGLSFRAPVRAATSGNFRAMNPFAKAAIVKRERKATAQAFEAAGGHRLELEPTARYLVKLVRIGPNELDEGDNLPGSMKACRDELADLLGLKSDRDARVRWSYDQRSEGHLTFKDEKGKKRRTGIFAVEVLIRRQVCADCFVEHCECLHQAEPCEGCA